jgi:hypothetical protein
MLAGTRSLRFAVAVVTGAVALAVATPTGAAALTPYAGLGTWIDIYDPRAWDDPEGTVAAIAARGVRTIYLETANYKAAVPIVRASGTARMIDAAHEVGVRVVAWYLPSFANVKRDLARSLAAVEFVTAGGERFDSFALDIEAPVVTSPTLRTKRLLTLSRQLRAAVGPGYTLGAITPSPRGMELTASYWPGFPYAELATLYDVFLPMSYASYRVEGAAPTRDYTERSIAIIREETGDPDVPIHMIGGIADRTSRAETRGFMRAVADCAPLGYSFYDWFTTNGIVWSELGRPRPASGECG